SQARLPTVPHRGKADLSRMLDGALDIASVRIVDVARLASGVDGIDAEPVDGPPEHRELVAFALGAALRLDGVRIADEDQLAVLIEPPVGRRESDVADLEARAGFVAGSRREPRHRVRPVHDAARVVRVKAF